MRDFKKLIILLLGGSLATGAVLLLKSCSDSGKVEISTEKAVRRNIVETVSANGKVQPEVEVKISADVAGEVVEMSVKEGDRVLKGDPLLKINPVIYQSTLDRMEAGLNTTRANFANAKARLAQVSAQFNNSESSFNRNKKLFEQSAISQADFVSERAVVCLRSRCTSWRCWGEWSWLPPCRSGR